MVLFHELDTALPDGQGGSGADIEVVAVISRVYGSPAGAAADAIVVDGDCSMRLSWPLPKLLPTWAEFEEFSVAPELTVIAPLNPVLLLEKVAVPPLPVTLRPLLPLIAPLTAKLSAAKGVIGSVNWIVPPPRRR